MKKTKRLAYDPGGAISFRSPARTAATPLELRDFREGQPPSAAWTTYHPTWRDNATDWALGFFGDKPSLATRTRVERFMGNAPPATSDFVSPVDFTPAGAVFSADEAYRKYKLGNYSGAAWDAVGAVPGGALSVLGKGAKTAKRAIQRGVDVSAGRRGLSDFPLDQPARDFSVESKRYARKQMGRPLASRTANLYDPPDKPHRPFEADYPDGASADEAGRLLFDIEGRPLTARFIAGRNMVGQGEKALSPTEFNAITAAATGTNATAVAPRILRGDAGRASFDRYTGEPTGIAIANDLSEAQAGKVLGHEVGHVIDQLAGEIPADGLLRELRSVYNTLNTGRERLSNLTGPQHFGYKGADIRRELMAEAIRAYLTSPNYIKSVAPKAAQQIRKYVNPNSKINKIIQFNGKVLPYAVSAGTAFQQVSKTDKRPEGADTKRFGDFY